LVPVSVCSLSLVVPSPFIVHHWHGWTFILLVVQAWFQKIRIPAKRASVIYRAPIQTSRSDLIQKWHHACNLAQHHRDSPVAILGELLMWGCGRYVF